MEKNHSYKEFQVSDVLETEQTLKCINMVITNLQPQ